MSGKGRGRRFCIVLINVVVIGVVVLSAAALAHAQGPNSVNGPSSILDEYKGLQNGWITKLLGAAQRLFFLLAGIEVAWSFTLLAIEKADFQALTAAIVRKIMWIGIFYQVEVGGFPPSWTAFTSSAKMHRP
jgi:type IV secretion system protein TrbL